MESGRILPGVRKRGQGTEKIRGCSEGGVVSDGVGDEEEVVGSQGGVGAGGVHHLQAEQSVRH